MIGERENFDSETNYGSLVMRSFDIDGNEINAFYDSSDDLIFVLDNTINEHKPNVLLVINPDADKKWDEILSGDYGIDLETIRPKQDNKYQKLDIEYSGLSIYDNLINAYNAGDSLEEPLTQLTILRDSAVRHSAMMRLNVANEVIAKTNATIVKTKETIVRLQARLKTLRAKLSETKKGIGRVPTKQSASKILKLESQIEAIQEKIKRAQARLKSAQRRLETATVDAELASGLLNQPSEEIKKVNKKSKSVMVAPKHAVVKTDKKVALPVVTEEDEQDTDEDEDFYNFEEEGESMETDVKDTDNVVDEDVEIPEYNVPEDNAEDRDSENDEEYKDSENDEDVDNQSTDKDDEVKPLFNEDPEILNEDIAFKPISFESPSEETTSEDENVPVLNKDVFEDEEKTNTETEQTMEFEQPEEKPVLESMQPVPSVEEYREMAESFVEDEPKDSVPNNVVEQDAGETKPVLETMTPVVRQQEPVLAEETTDSTDLNKDNNMSTQPVIPTTPVPPVAPMPPVMPNANYARNDVVTQKSKPTFVYYLLLVILIVLAVFTLWLYQKHVQPGTPVLTPSVEQTESNSKTTFFKQKEKAKKQVVQQDTEPDVFVDEEKTVQDVKEQEEVVVPEPEYPEEPTEPGVPEVLDDVPSRVTTSGQGVTPETTTVSEEDILANKPVYEPGAKHEEMFVAEDYVEDAEPNIIEQEIVDVVPEESEDVIEYVDENDPFYDAEEEAYQAEQAQEQYYEE